MYIMSQYTYLCTIVPAVGKFSCYTWAFVRTKNFYNPRHQTLMLYQTKLSCIFHTDITHVLELEK
jgi:hypothetical protein